MESVFVLLCICHALSLAMHMRSVSVIMSHDDIMAIHVYIHTYAYIHAYLYMYTYIPIHIYIKGCCAWNTSMCAARMCVCGLRSHVLSANHRVTADKRVCVYLCVSVCVCVCVRARARICHKVMRMFSGGSMLGLSTCSRKSARKAFHK